MLTSKECLAKADELDAVAGAYRTADGRAQYRTMAASWRDLARQAAWQDAFSEGATSYCLN